MTQDKFINVREVLQQNSYTTTVDELRNRGKSRVRVINAEQISSLIEEAVNRVVATSSGMGRDDVKKLVERSREEFKRLLAEREKELSEHRERVQQLDQSRENLAKTTAEAERLRIVEMELRRQNEAMSSQLTELRVAAKTGKGLAEVDLAEMERLRKNEAAAQKERESLQAQVAELRRAEAEMRRAETEARKEKEALLQQIKELTREVHELAAGKKAEPAPAAVSPEMVEVLRSLASEVASVKAGLKEVASRPAETAGADKAVTDRMEEITKALTDKMEKIGKKVGVSAGAEDQEVVLDNIFAGQEALESNIQDVEVKERKGTGISGAIERIKSLRNKKGEKKS